MGRIGHGRNQSRVDHGCADSEEHARHKPPAIAVCCSGQTESSRLHPHARSDESLSAPAVAQRAGHRLEHTPDHWIEGFERADALDAEAKGSEKEREYSPAHAVVEIVDKTGL